MDAACAEETQRASTRVFIGDTRGQRESNLLTLSLAHENRKNNASIPPLTGRAFL